MSYFHSGWTFHTTSNSQKVVPKMWRMGQILNCSNHVKFDHTCTTQIRNTHHWDMKFLVLNIAHPQYNTGVNRLQTMSLVWNLCRQQCYNGTSSPEKHHLVRIIITIIQKTSAVPKSSDNPTSVAHQIQNHLAKSNPFTNSKLLARWWKHRSRIRSNTLFCSLGLGLQATMEYNEWITDAQQYD